MTIVEKRDLLYAYCKGRDCADCKLCVINNWEHPCHMGCPHIGESPETDLDRAISIINDKSDAVNSPSHYADGKIEVIDFIEDKKLGFCLGNAVKYIARAGKKDPTKEVEDLKKARWYIERRIKEIEEGKLC